MQTRRKCKKYVDEVRQSLKPQKCANKQTAAEQCNFSGKAAEGEFPCKYKLCGKNLCRPWEGNAFKEERLQRHGLKAALGVRVVVPEPP